MILIFRRARKSIVLSEKNIKQDMKKTVVKEYYIQGVSKKPLWKFNRLEECDFDRKFLFDEYVTISHRYG